MTTPSGRASSVASTVPARMLPTSTSSTSGCARNRSARNAPIRPVPSTAILTRADPRGVAWIAARHGDLDGDTDPLQGPTARDGADDADRLLERLVLARRARICDRERRGRRDVEPDD